MIAERTIPAMRSALRKKSSISAASATPISPDLVNIPEVSMDKLLWLGNYLRAKKESSGGWILSDMGWLMENTTHTLAEIINKASNRLFSSIGDNVVSISIVHTPLLNINAIQSKLTADTVSVEVDCSYEHNLTGTRYDIDQALQHLLYAAPQLCGQKNVQQNFTLLNHWNAPLLQISHAITGVPPEMFDYLFHCDNGNCLYQNSETPTRMEWVVQQCSVTYNLNPDNRNNFIVLSMLSHIHLTALEDTGHLNSFLPVTASFQWIINE